MSKNNEFVTIYQNKVTGKAITGKQMENKYLKAKTEHEASILNKIYEPIIIEHKAKN